LSKRRDLERHLHSLREIKDIMNAMKNLALMETHKLTRVLATQRRVLADLEAAAQDFFAFHPELADIGGVANEISLLFGSERGFCGDFNETIVQLAETHAPAAPRIVIGARLSDRLLDDPRIVARVTGPSVLEEVETVLLQLMEQLDAWQATQPEPRPLRPTLFYHQADVDSAKILALHPSGSKNVTPAVIGYAPRLNMEPTGLLVRFTEHYLFAALCASFYDSLMAENQRRMHHMEYAVQRIEQDSERLVLRRNSLRQEEITEEIEIIMLSLQNAL
jgi:F-type H+-transporting ATPase subunit gamma